MKKYLTYLIGLVYCLCINIGYSQIRFTATGLDFLTTGNHKGTIDVIGNTFRIASVEPNQDLSLQTGGANERLRISSAGSVGIGLSPSTYFRVAIAGSSTLQPFGTFDDKNSLSNSDFWNNSTQSNAGVALRLVTTRPNTTLQNVASIEKYRNGLLSFKNFDSNGSMEFFLQNTGSTTAQLIIETDGGVKVPTAGIKFGGTPVAGSLRWTGSDFQGYNGSQWLSLLNNQAPPQTFWATASPSANCSTVCPSGYAPAADANGNTCKNLAGAAQNSVSYDRFIRYEGSVRYGESFWGCGSSNGTLDYSSRLAQCHCIRVN